MKYNATLVTNCGNFAEASIMPIYACGRIIQNSVSGYNSKQESANIQICVKLLSFSTCKVDSNNV